jgi:hypothetical protein
VKNILERTFHSLVDIVDNPVSKGVAFALWAIPLYFLLDIEISGSDYDNIKDL